MGSSLSCCSCLLERNRERNRGRERKHGLNDRLIRDVYCPKCHVMFLSTYEFNKHIVNCNRIFGDL